MARPKGSKNKVEHDVRVLARKHGPRMIGLLAQLAENAESQPARVAAIKEILDRGYGKAVQPVDGDGEGGPVKIDNTLTIQFVRPSLKEG